MRFERLGFPANRIYFGKFFIFFIVCYFIFLACLANTVYISNDEVFTLNTSSYGLSKVISQSYNFEGQPPAYFALLSLWRKLNPGLFFARMFSIFSILAAAWFIYRIVYLATNSKDSKGLLFLYFLNPFVVWAALETRLYAFIVLIGAVSVYCFSMYLKEGRSRYLYLNIVVNILGLYTQYFFVFLIASMGFALLIMGVYRKFFRYAISCIPVAILFVYNMVAMRDPVNMAFSNSIPLSGMERLSLVLHAPQDILLSLGKAPFDRPIRWLILFAAGIAIVPNLITSLLGKKDPGIGTGLRMAVYSSIFVITAFCLFFVVTKIDFHERYFAMLFPVLFLVFLPLQLYSPGIRALLIGLVSLYYIFILSITYRYPVKEYDLKAIMAYANSVTKTNEPICFYEPLVSVPFIYSNDNKNLIIPIPDSLHYNHPSSDTKIKDTATLKNAMDKLNTKYKSLILITTRTERKFLTDQDLILFNSFLVHHYRVTLDTVIYGHNRNWPVRVRRLETR